MKLFLKIAGSIIILFILLAICGMIYLRNGLDEGRNITLKGINTSVLKDGEYTGKFEFGRWSNEIAVTIKNQKISDLKLINDVKFPKKEVTDEIFKRVIENQNTKVDVVSGSTVTSKAYLMSIENALNK